MQNAIVFLKKNNIFVFLTDTDVFVWWKHGQKKVQIAHKHNLHRLFTSLQAYTPA